MVLMAFRNILEEGQEEKFLPLHTKKNRDREKKKIGIETYMKKDSIKISLENLKGLKVEK